MNDRVYCVVLADVVPSRKLPEPQRLQHALETSAAHIGHKYHSDLAAQVTITSGDELQALLRTPARAFDLILDAALLLLPFKVRFGVGWGEITTPLRPTTGSLSGPAFFHARRAVELARRQSRWVAFAGFGEVADTLTVVADCAASIVQRWTPAQRQSASAFLEHGTHEAAAQALGLARSTVTRNLSRGLVSQVVRCRDHLRELLARLPRDHAPSDQHP